MESDIAKKYCVPCAGTVSPFTKRGAGEYLRQVSGWQLSDDFRSISRAFNFENFKEALAFVNKIGAIAEAENHHPDIEFGWSYANVKLSTHAIAGLSENDFILAAKINTLSP